MKKKLIILCLTILLMTGCSVEYTLEIKDGVVNELFEAYETDINKANSGSPSFRTIVEDYKNINIPLSCDTGTSDTDCSIEGACELYDKEVIVNNDEVSITLSTSRTIAELYDSSIANEYGPRFSSVIDGDILTVSIEGNLNFTKIFDDLDDLTIKIKTDYKVEDTNATKDINGDYVWTFPKDEKTGRLYIKLNTKEKEKKSEQKKEKTDEEKTKEMVTILLVVSLAVLVLIFVIYTLSQKRKNNNRL